MKALLAVVLLTGLIQPTCAADALDQAASTLARTTGATVRQYSTRDFGREPYTAARSALVPEDRAQGLLATLRRQLPPGIVAFVGATRSYATPPAKGVELVVALGKDQFDILRIAATNAVNYDMLTEDLIKELRSWDKELGIDIVQAETDTIVLNLRAMPKDLEAFVKRVYEFCPDIVDQGTGTLSGLVQEVRRTRQVYLWWD